MQIERDETTYQEEQYKCMNNEMAEDINGQLET